MKINAFKANHNWAKYVQSEHAPYEGEALTEITSYEAVVLYPK
jgi:hypothetical protein